MEVRGIRSINFRHALKHLVSVNRSFQYLRRHCTNIKKDYEFPPSVVNEICQKLTGKLYNLEVIMTRRITCFCEFQ